MKHIILAAGQGKRLRPHTNRKPKVLVSLGRGKTLLDFHIQNSLKHEDLSEIVVVTGYKSSKIEKRLRTYGETKIKAVFNKHYTINNPMYSLESVLEKLGDDDFILSNGDTFYHTDVLKKALTAREKNVLFVSLARKKKKKMHVKVDDDKISQVGPSSILEAMHESAGLVVIRGKKSRAAFQKAVQSLLKQHKDAHFWHDVLNELGKTIPICTQEISITDWHEVDTPSDLRKLQQKLKLGK